MGKRLFLFIGCIICYVEILCELNKKGIKFLREFKNVIKLRSYKS